MARLVRMDEDKVGKQARLLLNAVHDRTKIWNFMDIYTTRDSARRAAAGLFVRGHNGVKVKQTAIKTFIVLAWKTNIE
jgi:hypothetical protein